MTQLPDAGRPGAGGGAGRVRASGRAVRAPGRDLHPERSLARHPLFQVMLAFQNLPRLPVDLPELTVSPVPAVTGAARFDLSVHCARSAPGAGGLGGRGCLVAADLFDAGRRGDRGAAGAGAGAGGGGPGAAGESGRGAGCGGAAELVAGWNETAAPVPDARRWRGCLRRRWRRVPDAVAVVCGEAVVSYRCAGCVRRRGWRSPGRVGAGPESVVAVVVPRSAVMVTAVLGVWGGGGVPAGGPGLPGGADRVHAGGRAGGRGGGTGRP